jgi:hypothetical protein
LSIRNLKRWWQIRTGRVETPVDSDVPFWAVSLLFHLALIVLLARMMIPGEEDQRVNLEIDTSVDDIEQLELPPEIEFDDLVVEEVGAKGEDGFEAAASQAPIIDILSEDAIDIEMPEHEFGELVTNDDFESATGQSLSSVPIKGSVGQSVKAAEGAVDRMTQEILLSLEERNTLVIWLFDQSASLMLQREEILARFDKIYDELGVVRAAGHGAFTRGSDKPLVTQIYAFGSQVTPMLKAPTDDLPTIKQAVSEIERDNTGVENVMTAVISAAKKYSSLRKIKRSTGEPERNVLLIVVSDEAGDDVERLNEAVRVCNRIQVPVHVIGVPAPFGRAETLVKWVDPDPDFDQSPQWAVVSQGPESVQSERLRLDFTGTFNDLEMIDSGFGPFHLTRLSYETGGIYFAVHPNRNTKRRVRMSETSDYAANLQYFFDPDIMRRYKPDYVSVKTYLQRLEANAARRALVQAAAFTTTGTLESPRLRFPNLDEARFVTLVTNAQQTAAIIEPQVDRLYEILRAGEQDREKELSPRWQAGFDLAIGRAIAAKVRAESYNAMLALIKTKLKFDPPADADTPQNNTWRLRPADTTETGSQDAKLLAKANTYLNRVIDEHSGTPWAMLAERELATPIGWKWQQSYTRPPQPRQPRPNANNNNNRRNLPQPRENQMPKKRRPPPKL